MASPIKNSNQGGKRPGQKYKSLLVWHFLLRRTDEDHAVSSSDIISHLEQYGIRADRHSISRDINDMLYLLSREQELYRDDDIDESEMLGYAVEYDRKLHGYKVTQRPYEFDDLRLLAECVRATKFISKPQEKNLLHAIDSLCSEAQVKELENEVYVVGRTKTYNRWVMASMLKIKEAVRDDKKISFKYTKYSFNNREERIEKKKGERYIVSPFMLLINEGNYYLLAFDDKRQRMMTYRVDRMKEVKKLSDPREGKEEYAQIDMSTYTQRVFSMFEGKTEHVSIRFIMSMLDTVIERFGTENGTKYIFEDAHHFIVKTDVAISRQFYSWVCGFRESAVIIDPPEAVEGMKKFLKTILKKYES